MAPRYGFAGIESGDRATQALSPERNGTAADE